FRESRMPNPQSASFNCPNCGAKYEIVRVEAPPHPTADRGVKCVSCGGSFQGRGGMFVFKNFFVGRPRWGAPQRRCCRESFIKRVQVAVGCKDPFACPKAKASVSTGAAEAFLWFKPASILVLPPVSLIWLKNFRRR